MQDEIVTSVLLAPSPKQQKQLDQIFSGPRLIAQLLREEKKPICWPDEASLFLLRRKDQLEPFLFTQDRDRAIDLLKSLVLRWSNQPPPSFGISFESNCSISAVNQVFFPIEQLGTLSVEDAQNLHEARQGTRYGEGFSLVCEGRRFYAEIPFLRRAQQYEIQGDRVDRSSVPTKKQENTKHKKIIKPAQAFEYKNFIKIFNRRINQQLMHELEISKSLKTVRFGELSGRPVQGGLPSLGKRR